MNEGGLNHADIASALAHLEARQRIDSPDAAVAVTSRLIVELQKKFSLGNDDVDRAGDGSAEGPQEPEDQDLGAGDDDLDEVESDWTERLRRDTLLSEEDQIELARQIEAGVIAQAVLVGDWYLSGPWAESELEVLVERGTAAFDQVLSGNYRLVLYWARRYARGYSDLVADLFQDGFFGLVRSIQGWDYLRGYRFSTYATWQIRAAMQRGMYLRYLAAPVHIPVHVLEEIKSLNGSVEHLSPNAVLALSWLERWVSWERLEEEVPELTNRLEPDFETTIISRLAMEVSARQILTFLDERDALVLALRSGIGGGEPATLDVIGQMLEVTRERVRQLEIRAMLTVRLRVLSQSQALQTRVVKRLRLHRTDEGDLALQCLKRELLSVSAIAAELKVGKVLALRIAERLASTLVECDLDLSDLPSI